MQSSLRILGGMQSLEELEFWACAGITDEGVTELAALPRLRRIALDSLPGVTVAARARFRPGVDVVMHT